MKPSWNKLLLLVMAVVFFQSKKFALGNFDYGDELMIELGKGNCFFKDILQKVYGGLLIDSTNVSNMASYTFQEFQVVEMQCAVARLQTDEIVFRWVQDCPSGEIAQPHFVLSNPWVNKTTVYQSSACRVYEQSSTLIRMMNKTWNQCNITCHIDVKNKLETQKLNISYSILLKVLPTHIPHDVHILQALGCAYYFRFIEILFTVGAVSLIVFYLVWFKLCYKCRKSNVPVDISERKASVILPYPPDQLF